MSSELLASRRRRFGRYATCKSPIYHKCTTVSLKNKKPFHTYDTFHTFLCFFRFFNLWSGAMGTCCLHSHGDFLDVSAMLSLGNGLASEQFSELYLGIRIMLQKAVARPHARQLGVHFSMCRSSMTTKRNSQAWLPTGGNRCVIHWPPKHRPN